jgi:hypothetical protein
MQCGPTPRTTHRSVSGPALRKLAGTIGLCAIVATTLAGPTGSGGRLDASNTQRLTLFHLNPAAYGDAPVNMNTADARGDLFFFFSSLYEPVECEEGGDMSGSATSTLVSS